MKRKLAKNMISLNLSTSNSHKIPESKNSKKKKEKTISNLL